MKKIATTVAGLAMLVALAGPAAAATPKANKATPPTPIAAKAAKNAKACSHRKGAHNKCAVKRTQHGTAKVSKKKSTTPTTKKH
jgi:hypothetical protein